jgi:phosphate transport system permease protein
VPAIGVSSRSPAELAAANARIEKLITRRKIFDLLFMVVAIGMVVISLSLLGLLIYSLMHDGLARIRPDFFTNFPSRRPEQAGIKSAFVGTCLVMFVTACTAIPLGVAAGIYLEEYARKNWFTAIIEINIANLSGVPSIIWGLMALGLFIYQFERWFGDPTDSRIGLGRSVLTAGMTLGLLVLPIVIVATREAIRAIPQGIREASFACGATKLQTVWYHILPYSMSGVLTGSIIALSRAIGETAPLITIGALTFVAFLPPLPGQEVMSAQGAVVGHAGLLDWLGSAFTVLPIQMFNWVSRPDQRFHANAAATGLVLLVLTLGINAVAIVIRYRLRKRIQW